MHYPGLSTEQKARIQAAWKASPSAMSLQLARKLELPEAEVIREMPEGRSIELDPTHWETLFRFFENLGSVHLIVSNGCVTCETVGQFGGFSTWGEFFNVQTQTLDPHIRHAQLASIFAVAKPSHMDGTKTLSVQFFDRHGNAALKVFFNFGGKPTPIREQAFEDLCKRFQLGANH